MDQPIDPCTKMKASQNMKHQSNARRSVMVRVYERQWTFAACAGEIGIKIVHRAPVYHRKRAWAGHLARLAMQAVSGLPEENEQ
ncbi:hypothetical protein JJL52_01075 [Methylomicrobium sp. RS1]|nr:hypothetical protein [Methylomicrobium sp. RS1]